jgi:tetratricopeptide (TPR) repeat protein
MNVRCGRRAAVVVLAVVATWSSLRHATGQPASSSTPGGQPAAGARIPEIEEAAKIFRSGDYDGALKSLQAAAKKYPDLAPPHVIMAGLFAASNQGAMVRGALEQAVISSPSDPEAYQLLGETAMRSREVTDAGLLFEKVLAITSAVKDASPRIVSLKRRALGGLARVAEARQDWAAAQTHLEALLAEEPKNAVALQQLGRMLFMQKKEDLAVDKLREAAKANEGLLSAEVTLAQLYQQSGDVKNAGKWMLEAIKASPRDPKTRLAAAQWSYEIGKLDQAEEQAKAAVQLDPESLNCQLIRGLVALVRKDFKTAQEFYEKAHLQSPSNFEATNNLALALAGQEEETKRRLAMEYAQINARVYPDQAEALSTLGWAYYRLGRLDEAEANLRKASSFARPTPDALYFLARILVERGRKEDAKMILQSPAMKSPAPYLMRKEAETLLEELSGR